MRGALAVARRHGWAFVGASLHALAPLCGLAGLAFDQALRLSALTDQAPAFVAPRRAVAPPAAAPGRESVAAELEAARHDAARAAEALREALQAGHTLRDRLDAAEAARLEAERSRDDWARQAGSLGARNEKQAAEILELKRGMAGARETAAAAADVAEAREVRIRELEAELQRAPRRAKGSAPGPTRRRPRPLSRWARWARPRLPTRAAGASARVGRPDGRRPRNPGPAPARDREGFTHHVFGMARASSRPWPVATPSSRRPAQALGRSAGRCW